MKYQLLCTFTHKKDLPVILDYIQKSYIIPENRIFVLSNKQNPSELFCTYNITGTTGSRTQNTISIHRKTETNTLYTVNALNRLIYELTGKVDSSYVLPWGQYQNTFLLTDNDTYRLVPLVFVKQHKFFS